MKITTWILTGLLLSPMLSVAQEFDHNYKAWDTFLMNHVDKQGRVDYPKALKNQANLGATVKQLGAVTAADIKSWSRDQQLAYWINAYNAFTMRAILDNYPLKRGSGIKARFYPANSIRQIPGVWDKITWNAAGENITLGDIENVKLRKDLDEPRIHFAIVCASIGCPNLKDKAYTADKVEAQLELESKKFVRNVDKVKVDHTKEVLYLSKIFDWFTDDFKAYTGASDYGDNAGAAAFVARYSSPATSNALLKTEYDVKWLDYDWSLNAQ